MKRLHNIYADGYEVSYYTADNCASLYRIEIMDYAERTGDVPPDGSKYNVEVYRIDIADMPLADIAEIVATSGSSDLEAHDDIEVDPFAVTEAIYYANEGRYVFHADGSNARKLLARACREIRIDAE